VEIQRLADPVDPIALAAHPDLEEAALVTVDGWTVVVGDPLAVVTDLDGLADLAARIGWSTRPPAEDGGHRGRAGDPQGVPFAAGAVGWIGDDISRAVLDVPGVDPRPHTPTGGLRFGVRDAAVCIAPDGTAWVAAADIDGLSREPASTRLTRWARLVSSAASAPGGPAFERQPAVARFSIDEAQHADAVDQAHDWIAAGDLYQLNLTLQVGVAWEHGASLLARRLFAASAGAPHRAWLRCPDIDIISVSPETFLRVDGERITTRPIKGTRPRRTDPIADDAEAAALLRSAKDRAEHVMIVDLERNDLGRICEVASVAVPELIALERHPTVWHLASTVTGRLRPGTGLAEVLAATFPSGSVTGAPKRMAWQRIAALEPVRRGVYCGAIGVVTPGGCDLSVAIRTAVLSAGIASYGTGGGIVADSVPAAEWAEAMHKARAFAAATGAVLPATGPRPSRSSGSRSAC
jgi:para-aminobenzoate synthetase component I